MSEFFLWPVEMKNNKELVMSAMLNTFPLFFPD